MNKIDTVCEFDSIFHELVYECKRSAPGSRLSHYLRNKLQRLSPSTRKHIVNRIKLGCSPLFIACMKGQLEIVEYLITVCLADIEQKGLYEVDDDRSTHVVTPIWGASVSGRLSVVEVLLKHGADINAVSDSGSTPVRSACFMSHFHIVKYLVENGADINRPNYNGGTCLINSVQSVSLCEFLIKNGADVNARDIQNKTALHYAIQEHRLETTQLLIRNGADYNAVSRYGDDALQMACLKGASAIFEYLTSTIEYPPEKLANSRELMGATFLDDHNDMQATLSHWCEATKMRQKFGLLPKAPVMPLCEGYRNQKEFESLEELEAISADIDAIRIQSLLMAERILGPFHKDTIFRLMYRGASYADMMRFQRCIELWRRALEIRIEKDTILYTDTCFTAQALVRIMIDYSTKSTLNKIDNKPQRFHDIVQTFQLLTRDIAEYRQLLLVRPVYKRQLEFFDKTLKCITHLIALLIEAADGDANKALVKNLVTDLIRKDVRGVLVDDTILHLCVSKLNVIKSSYFSDDELIMIFPNKEVVKLVLECGALVNARNEQGWTPLHVGVISYNYSEWLLDLLLGHGAHIDIPNGSGKTPCEALKELSPDETANIHILDHVNLKCLCSRTIVENRIPYRNQIPKTLENFVKMHEP